MTPEITLLDWSVFLGLGHVLVAGTLSTWQRGWRWNVGNRDGQAEPLTGMAARATRASRNFFETFPLFAAVVLAVVLTHRNGAHTLLGAQCYFWARLAYLPVYIAGIPYLRTAIWIVSLWGFLQVAEALL